jgi:hypothetical protein
LLLGPEHDKSFYQDLELVTVDSGSYELDAFGFEGSEMLHGHHSPQKFSLEDFKVLVGELPRDRNILVVSYANPGPKRPSYAEQRAEAQTFFTPGSQMINTPV